MKKYDIFISYSRKDFDEVNQIVEMLKSRIPTLNCWFDITGIESGDEFEDKIITAIDNSSYVLFALSDNSIQSQWAKDEVMYAKNTDTKVIPLVLKGAQLKGWFLFKFGRIDCIDTTNSLQIEKLIKNLADWTRKASVKCSDSSSSVSSSKTSSSSAKGEIKKDNVQASSSNIQTIYRSNGKVEYVGEVKNGQRHGQGTYYFADGRKYEGQWKDDKKHGQGTFYWPDGDKYIGQWENDKRHGQGTYFFKNGCKYEGQWKEGKKHGQGSENYTSGERYTGQYADGQRNGQGTYYWADGDKYEGQFKEGLFHGQGTYYYANGDKYVGQYENDKRHGQGTFYYADGRQEPRTYNNGNRV